MGADSPSTMVKPKPPLQPKLSKRASLRRRVSNSTAEYSIDTIISFYMLHVYIYMYMLSLKIEL